ncbi:hypothetical protein HY490_03515 [Candidatus Woesearchaeota archaeon]|nr:hypothetical protein [Candidatus Woesearchaeota archaeon]
MKDHQLPETVKIAETALNYFTVYRELGGTKSKDEIESDFLIVAAASINNLDVVVSEDESTLRSELARKAYLIVNGVQKLRNPEFIGYENLKRLFSV